jgi:Mn-dependent DtxR family transcriptional regulator
MLISCEQLTDLQRDYLMFVITYAQDHNGNSPGLRETAKHFGVHPSTARGHLGELANKRLLRFEDRKIIVEESVWTPPPITDF